MSKARLEAFTDAVLAIVMTILVLELAAPAEGKWSALWEMRESFGAYGLSFFLLAIYWVNHHHLFQLAERVDGRVLWTNIILIFWMSLVPFVTAWVGKDMSQRVPAMSYGVLFLLMNLSYSLVQRSLIRCHDKNSKFYRVYGNDKKIFFTFFASILAVLSGFIYPLLVLILVGVLALLWVIPSKETEKIFYED